MKLRAICDFDPKEMRYNERVELEHILKCQRQNKSMNFTENLETFGQNKGIETVPTYRNTRHESEEVVTKNSSGQKLRLNAETYGRLKVAEEEDLDAADWREEDLHSRESEDERSTSIDLDETYKAYAKAIPFKRDDMMETIPSANIG